MPVIRTKHTELDARTRPAWSTVTSAGSFRIARDGGQFDCHYHDCDEYWLIYQGKAKVMSEGREHYVMAGDILCIRAGDEHDVLEVYEDIEAFWFELETPAGGRLGHLHRDEDRAKGHPVKGLPVPADFPAA